MVVSARNGHNRYGALPVGVADLLDDAVQLLRSLTLPLPLQLVCVRPQIELVDLYKGRHAKKRNACAMVAMVAMVTVAAGSHESACQHSRSPHATCTSCRRRRFHSLPCLCRLQGREMKHALGSLHS